MSSFYYLGIGVFSLAMTIYNFEKASQIGDYTLLKNQTQIETRNISYANGSIIPKEFPYIEKVETTNAIEPLLYIIAIVFLLFLVLSLYMSCIINSFSNLLPEDFLTMSKCKAAVTCLCKIIPPIFLILSWLNLILIVVVWILYAVYFKDESKDYPKYQFEPRSDSVSEDVLILNIVNSVIWFVTHYGGSIIREMTYIEPFMYSPDTGETPNCFRTLMIKKLGP